ncbi:hypothetical protein [Agrobacterium vitis]|uniref:hypothetical protein n=1 Tax=Agrobacterium vitis TaxID=373 RepID=UPI001F331ED2|nr:hypothetical protein [Agrobacterium vitis]WEO75489.1 hypothetical protein G6L01_026125 [Agrobacterium vitis]
MAILLTNSLVVLKRLTEYAAKPPTMMPIKMKTLMRAVLIFGLDMTYPQGLQDVSWLDPEGQNYFAGVEDTVLIP